MRKLPIDIQEIADAMDTRSESMTLYLDTASGEVVAHFLEDNEDNAEIDFDDPIYLPIPGQDSDESYRWMAQFVDDLKDQKLARSLENALRGKGPFRRFKDVLSGDPHQLKRWYDYRELRLVKNALDWLRGNDIEPQEIDDELLAQPDCGETMRTVPGRSVLPADDGPGIDPHQGKPATRTDLISPSEYLAQELTSAAKREYLGGVVYAMSGASNRHNRIATSLLGSLTGSLRGQRCEAFNSDTKVRVQLPTHVRFYYPDAMVVCSPNPQGDSFQDTPSVIIEVLSMRTRRTDEGEKREAYLAIPSLVAYLLVEQETAAVVVFRRAEQGFVREVWQGIEATINLPEVGLKLPLAEIYDRVEFGAEAEEG